MNTPEPNEKTTPALAPAPLLGHHSSHNVWRLWWDGELDSWQLFRRLRIRCFFGFCEFAVTHRGGVYLLRWAMVAEHLFEHLKLVGLFHDRFCVVCRVWWPNDKAEPRADNPKL